MSREEHVSFVETICLEDPESMMKLGELDVPATKACTLSLSSKFDPPSLFFEQSGREMLLFSRSWLNMSNLILHIGALKMIALTTVCALSHFSFVLLLLGVLLGARGLLLRLSLVSLLLRWIFRFFLSF